jgi:hypothetical protein
VTTLHDVSQMIRPWWRGIEGIYGDGAPSVMAVTA